MFLSVEELHERLGGARTVATERRKHSKGLRRTKLIEGKKPIPRRKGPCPRGKVLRRAYTRTSSATGKRTRVKAKCIRAEGLSVKKGQAVRTGVAAYKIKRPGLLRQFGYSQTVSGPVRRAAISKAVKQEGALPVLRHMQLIVTRSRNRAKNRQGVLNMAKDIQWLGKREGYSGYAEGKSAEAIEKASRRTYTTKK